MNYWVLTDIEISEGNANEVQNRCEKIGKAKKRMKTCMAVCQERRQLRVLQRPVEEANVGGRCNAQRGVHHRHACAWRKCRALDPPFAWVRWVSRRETLRHTLSLGRIYSHTTHTRYAHPICTRAHSTLAHKAHPMHTRTQSTQQRIRVCNRSVTTPCKRSVSQNWHTSGAIIASLGEIWGENCESKGNGQGKMGLSQETFRNRERYSKDKTCGRKKK